MTDEFVKVADAREIAEGKAKEVVVGASRILIANIGGQFFAIGSVCTHVGGPLARGRLEGGVVTCPWHGSKFDVKTGAVVGPPAQKPEPTFQVKVENGSILVKKPA